MCFADIRIQMNPRGRARKRKGSSVGKPHEEIKGIIFKVG